MQYTQPRPYNLGALDEFTGSVKQAVFTAPVLAYSGVDLGAEAIQKALTDSVWTVSVIPQLGEASTSAWSNFKSGVTGNTQYRYPNAKLQVTMKRRDGIGFDPDVAQTLLANAASSYGTKLAAFTEWLITVQEAASNTVRDLTPTEVMDTAGSYWMKKKDEIGRIGLGPAFGLPGWFFPVVSITGGGLALYLASGRAIQLKKTFGTLSGFVMPKKKRRKSRRK